MAIHGGINTCPVKPQTRQDTSYVDVQHKHPRLLRAVFTVLCKMEFVTNSRGWKPVQFHQSCAQESTWFLRNHSQQGNTGCLQVALKVLQCFCVEAGAHHGGNLWRKEAHGVGGSCVTHRLGPEWMLATRWGRAASSCPCPQEVELTDFIPSKQLGLGQVRGVEVSLIPRPHSAEGENWLVVWWLLQTSQKLK